jgi:uncharacterized protein with HEPN domain
MTKDQLAYLNDILDRIHRIESYTAIGKEEFLNSDLHQDAVLRSFEVIGEVVKRLDPVLTTTHTKIMWNRFAGFRDIIIHQYNKIRFDLVWEYVQEDLPPLKVTILEMIQQLGDGSTHA